jgi:DNA ligase-1
VRAFARLYSELDATTRSSRKVEIIAAHLASLPAEDAAWTVHLLAGGRVSRLVATGRLRMWLAAACDLPAWLVAESHQHVGDLAETLALLWLAHGPRGASAPEAPAAQPSLWPTPPACVPAGDGLASWVAATRPLSGAEPAWARATVLTHWAALGAATEAATCLLVYNKLLTGALRVGVARGLVIRALAVVAQAPVALIAHRMMGGARPEAAWFDALVAAPDATAPRYTTRPYPFALAAPLEGAASALGPAEGWLAEWKWDGVRAQVVRRGGVVQLWSRGDEPLTAAFPEVVAAAQALPDGLVLDGEILARGRLEAGGWAPRSFATLSRRLNRTRVSQALRDAVPVGFMAYDALERDGVDLRELPQSARRTHLEAVLAAAPPPLQISPLLPPSWPARDAAWVEARGGGAEGLMLKRADAPYPVGRVRGVWWKHKVAPHTVDMVLVAAQPGHGRRANLLTDYTLAVWQGEALVPAAKAYSGLTDAEIIAIDRLLKQHTTGRFGPVRAVAPVVVLEIAFEGVTRSARHRAGLALRFPRVARWRTDKPPAEADSLSTLQAHLEPEEEAACAQAPLWGPP